MVWGQYMDLIAAKEGGSTSSHWFDRFYVGTGLSRVVYRSYSYANAFGGVSYAYAGNDSSSTSAVIGVRLAFRGIIRWAGSVAAFKADFLIYTRVVYRSNNNANALGGVSYANANNDSSNTNANIGVRLANN